MRNPGFGWPERIGAVAPREYGIVANSSEVWFMLSAFSAVARFFPAFGAQNGLTTWDFDSYSIHEPDHPGTAIEISGAD